MRVHVHSALRDAGQHLRLTVYDGSSTPAKHVGVAYLSMQALIHEGSCRSLCFCPRSHRNS